METITEDNGVLELPDGVILDDDVVELDGVLVPDTIGVAVLDSE
jgi:hypothetical protein